MRLQRRFVLSFRSRCDHSTYGEKGALGHVPGLQRVVFAALAQRPDVTLTLACKVDGVVTTLTIPAGFDLLTPLGNEHMLTFDEIAKLVG